MKKPVFLLPLLLPVFCMASEIVVFESPHCPHCQTLKDKFFPEIEKLHNKKVKYFDMGKPQNYKIYLQYLKQIGLEVSLPSELPVVFYHNNVLVGEKEIREKLPVLLKGEDVITSDRIKKITLPVIMVTGLLDGINPCAFGVIVFFVSFLVATGKIKRRIVYIGSFYILGVFLTYFMIGVFLKGFLNIFFQLKKIISLIFLVSGACCVFVGFLNLMECKRNLIEYKIKLPDRVKKRIHRIIASFFMKKYHLPAAFLIGAIISIQESICTGQLYLPSILLISKFSRNMPLLLFIYNVFFIIPLLFIFSFVLVGMRSELLSHIFRKSLPLTKGLIGVVFLILGSLLIVFSFIR